MTRGPLGLLALASLAAASSDEAMAAVHANCYSLLTGMGRSSYSKTELSMLCRAQLPMEVCHAAANELGEKPWGPATIGRTCGKWEEQWTERSLRMTPEERELEQTDWQAKIDDITKKKAAVGICANKTAPMTMNECVSYKSREYPKYHKQLNDAYKEKRAAYDAAGKFEVVGHEVPAPSSPAAASGGVGAAALGVAGAVALAALARRRRTHSPLAEPGGDIDAELTQG